MTVTVTPDVMQDMAQDAYRQRVMIVAETQMHVAPWLHAEEGWTESRLKWAVEAVCAGQVCDTGLAYEVQGDTAVYRIPKVSLHRCPCPAAHYGTSQHCKHRVALELFRRVTQAYPEAQPLATQVLASHPDDDEPLGNGYPIDDETLPLLLPPVTADERLAAVPAPTMPQEARMPADEYIPEPDTEVSTTAVVEPKNVVSAVSTPATSSLDTRALLESMAAWKEQRQILARYIQEQLKDGVDYYTLRIKGRDTKPTLSKAGSEKFLAIFKMTATFQQDQATWTMLGSKEGVLCYTCTLLTRDGQVVGEGRGARTLAQDQGDINKAVKMAQKSAQIDAILRTGCLSDVFTQDINEPDEAPAAPPVKPTPTSQDMRQRIWKIVQYRAPEVKSREAVEAYIQEHTGMALHPDLYSAILARLEEAGR